MTSHRRHAVVLVLLMGIVALVAQLAGVSGSRATSKKSQRGTQLATVVGGAVPDVTSTTLASTKQRAGEGDTVRMTAKATLRVSGAKRAGTQVVCGIRYSRDGDPSWSLGTPYETVTVGRAGTSKRVSIERTFNAPASDTYRMKTACHVASKQRRAKVRASGTITTALGLPSGAATPAA